MAMDTILKCQSSHTTCMVHILGEVVENAISADVRPAYSNGNELHHVLLCKQVRRALWG